MKKRVIEGIEACRPGSNDLYSPELADIAQAVEHDPRALEYYERVQGWDAAISSCIDEVEIPAGLKDRILDRLSAAAASATDSSSALLSDITRAAAITDAGPRDVEVSQQKTSRWSGRQASHFSRRQWLAGFVSVAATLLLAAFLSNWLRAPGDLPLEDIAQQWSDQLGDGWQNMDGAPRGFTVPAAVMATATAWQWIDGHTADGGVAYRLRARNGREALLFVVRVARAGLPDAPPIEPQSNTAGKAVGYWRSGQHVYVLVVPGDQRSYRAFVGSSPAPLA